MLSFLTTVFLGMIVWHLYSEKLKSIFDTAKSVSKASVDAAKTAAKEGGADEQPGV